MKNITRNFALFVAALLIFVNPTGAQAGTFAAVHTTTESQNVKGLVKIEKRGRFHHSFFYELDGGDTLIMPAKIKGVKDIRTAAEKNAEHPIENKIRQFSARWNGPAQFAANAFTCIAYLVVLLK